MNIFLNSTMAVGIALAVVSCSAPESAEAPASEDVESDPQTEVSAEPVEPTSFEMDAITCWDLTTTSEEEQAFAATLLYGYAAGAAGANAQTSDGMEASIGAAFEYCDENPDATALSAFAQAEG